MSGSTAETGGGDHAAGHVPSASRPLPLNSKKITVAMLKQLARGLEVPTTSGGDELRQLVEGKLGDMGHEPRNTQLSVVTRENGVTLTLQDADGIFLTVDPLPVEVRTEADPEEEEGD